MKLVFLSAEWCEFCQEIKPEVNSLRKTFEFEDVELTKENRNFVNAAYKIPCIPAIFLMDDEENIIDSWHADMDKTFGEFIDKYL